MTSSKIKISLAATVLVAMSPFLLTSAALLGLAEAGLGFRHGLTWFVLWMLSPYAAIAPIYLLHRLDDAGLVEVD